MTERDSSIYTSDRSRRLARTLGVTGAAVVATAAVAGGLHAAEAQPNETGRNSVEHSAVGDQISFIHGTLEISGINVRTTPGVSVDETVRDNIAYPSDTVRRIDAANPIVYYDNENNTWLSFKYDGKWLFVEKTSKTENHFAIIENGHAKPISEAIVVPEQGEISHIEVDSAGVAVQIEAKGDDGQVQPLGTVTKADLG